MTNVRPYVCTSAISLATKLDRVVTCNGGTPSSRLCDLLIMWSREKMKKTGIYTYFPANIRLDKDVLKTSFVFVCRRRLQDVLIITNMFTLALRLQKTSSRGLGQDQCIRLGHRFSRRLQKVFKMSSRRLQDVLSKRLEDIFKTSSRRFEDAFKTSLRHLQDVFKTSCKDIFKTFSRRIIKLNCSC